jgi:ADP-heptose:LPS heptosyltransferase
MIYYNLFYKHCPEILGELYFRFGIRIIPENRYPLDPGGIKRICIFGTSGIGNLIMLTPMIRTLKAGIPDSKITVFVLPNGAKDVLEGSDLVDQVVVIDDKSKIGAIRHDFPDLAIAATHRGFMRAKEAFCTGAFWRIGFRYDHKGKKDTSFLFTQALPYDESKHEVEQGLDLIRPLGYPEIRKLYMHVEASDREFANNLLSESGIKEGDLIFGLFTGLDPNNPKRRCIPIERFAEIGNRLITEYDGKVVIVGGAGETPTAERIADLMENKPIILTGKTTLRQLATVTEKFRLFVSSDGGPMHIAAAMETPVVGIFGPTDWVSHAPYGEKCLVVKSDLPCSPCHKPHGEGVKCETLDCLKAITVDMVMEAVEQLMK